MASSMPKGFRAPAEQLYRAVIKQVFLSDNPPAPGPLPEGRSGLKRVLPPYFGEMGFELRYHMAQVEPWLRHGWKIVTRRPAFYPEGTAIAAPEFFATADALLTYFKVIGSHGGLHLPPLEKGKIDCELNFEGETGAITVHLSDVEKVKVQSLVEIELRKLFLEWFHSRDRPILDGDRFQLSFLPSAVGNHEYRNAIAVPPSFLPPTFVAPPEAIPPHVGVQLRNVANGFVQVRNSDADKMLDAASKIAAHLGLDLVVYGHREGCIIPSGYRTTWDAARPDGHLARELGYLKSCRIMLSPDSGWADLMAWLQIPTLLESCKTVGTFEPLRDCFKPKLRILDLSQPLGPQADTMIAATECILPDDGPNNSVASPELFPWEP